MVRAQAAVSRRPLEDSSSAEPRNPRVLIIEADDSARSVLDVSLKRDHFEVQVARSGAEAHRQLALGRELPDVVVLATRLGDEDGYSVCAELRGDRRTSAIPVVMLASAGEENPQALAEVVGVSQCLSRPLYVRDVAIHVRLAIAPRDESGAVILYTDEVSPAQALRAVLSSSQSGRLELLGGRGVVSFSDGRVLDAAVDGVSGGDAMVRALVLSAGQYTLKLGAPVGGPVLQFSLRDLVSTVFPRIARWERLLLRSVPLEALLQVDFAQLASALPELPDAVNGVVRLFDARRDVRRVLLDSPLHETITLEVITRLYLMGVLVPAAHALSDEGAPVAPVKLFEPRDTEAEETMHALFGDGLPDLQLPATEPSRAAEPDWAQAPEWDGVPPEAARTLQAFMTRTVIEPPEPAKDKGELFEFARGDLSLDQPSLSEALAQIAPTPPPVVRAEELKPWNETAEIEAKFFDQHEDPELTPVLAPSVSEAALGIEPVTRNERVGATSQTRANQAMTWVMVAALLLAGVALAIWQYAATGTPAPAVAPVQVEVAPAELELPPLEPVVEIVPQNPATVEALAEATALYEDGRWHEAVARLEQIVADDPTSSQAWLMLGLARYDSGDTNGAYEAANTTLAIDPLAARAHLLIATVYIAQGKRDEGRAEVEKYLQADPEGKYSEEARALLRR